MEVFLYNSTVCRLCGEENDNGTLLFDSDENNEELSDIINKYLPIKVSDDGVLPRTICPGCTIQLEATVEFFELIIKGQKIIREILQREIDYKKSLEQEIPETDVIAEKIVYEINTSDGVYHVEHPISLQIAGIDKPKRKRGRPSKKPKSPEELAQEAAAAAAAKEEEARQQAQKLQNESNGKRRRKTPPRLKETVQGKELEKIFIEEGVIDKLEVEPAVKEAAGAGAAGGEARLIGHEEGSGAPVLMSRGRGRPRGARGGRPPSQCAHCGLRFATVARYMSHLAQHHHHHHHPNKNKEDIKLQVTVSEEQPPEKQEEAQREPLEDWTNSEEVEVGAEEEGAADKKRLQCDHCPKTFGSRQSKSVHVKAVHRGERAHACGVCGARFAYARSLAHHRLRHRRAPGYACDECGKVLRHPSSVLYHKQAVHSPRRYVCGACGKPFHHRQLLQRHQLVHSALRPHACPHCPATFKSRATLRNHAALHAGLRRYACDVCARSFAHKTSLALHLRWHSGAKPFGCGACGKRFAQKGNLHEHERTHTGERPFACPACPRRFTTSSQRRLHARRHHHLQREPPVKQPAAATCATLPPAPPQESYVVEVVEGEEEVVGAEAEEVVYVAYDEHGHEQPLHIVHDSEVTEIAEENVVSVPQPQLQAERRVRVRMQDGSTLALASLDGRTLQLVTQDGHTIPVEVNTQLDSPMNSDPASGEHYYTIV